MWAQLAATVAPMALSLIGEAIAAGNDAEAERLRAQAMEEYGVEIPPVQELKAQAIRSQAATAQGSAQAKSTRMAALQKLSQRADEGYTAEDRAAINDVLSEGQVAERGSREAIMRRLPQNSGSQVAALLSNQQAAAQRANKQGLDIAAGSRANALRALSQTGSLAGDIDESEFGQSFRRGGAADAISQFNERNRMDAGRFNAQQHQQNYQNQLGQADRRSQMTMEKAEEERRKGDRWRSMFQGFGQGAGSGFSSYAGGGSK